MKFLKSLFRFYINASIHVAFAVVALTVFTYIQFELSVDYTLLCFIFLCSITGYNFVKYAPIAKLHHSSLTRQLKQIQIFSLFVFLTLILCTFFVSYKVVIICFGLGVFTLLYAVPIGQKNLREIGLLKVFIIASIWAMTTFILPLAEHTDQWNITNKIFTFYFLERVIWVVLLMIPFEIRDLKFDRVYLKTLVSTLGIKTVKISSVGLLILLLMHKIIWVNNEFIWVYSMIYFSLGLVILISKSNQKPYYSSFIVESLPLLWAILLLIY